jgi:hypothetical protein
MMLTIGLSYIAFILLRYISFIRTSIWTLSRKYVDFFKGCFCIYWDDRVISFLDFVYVLYYIYQFSYVEPSLHLWNETNLIIVYDLFNMLLNAPCQYFIDNFLHLCSVKRLAYNSFWLGPFLVFGLV